MQELEELKAELSILSFYYHSSIIISIISLLSTFVLITLGVIVSSGYDIAPHVPFLYFGPAVVSFVIFVIFKSIFDSLSFKYFNLYAEVVILEAIVAHRKESTKILEQIEERHKGQI